MRRGPRHGALAAAARSAGVGGGGARRGGGYNPEPFFDVPVDSSLIVGGLTESIDVNRYHVRRPIVYLFGQLSTGYGEALIDDDRGVGHARFGLALMR